MTEIQWTCLPDLHLHTNVTIDGRMKEHEASERAVSLGITEIAFTNHIMLNQSDYRMTIDSFYDHWDKIQECQRKYSQIKIRLGLEMDYYPNREDEIRETIKTYEDAIGRPFDFILGSVHEIRGGFFSSKTAAANFFKNRDLLTLYGEYFELATLAAQCHLFDVIAHPDLIKKYTGQFTPPIPFEQYKHLVEPFISAVLNNKIGIEINTKGLKLPVNEIYPSIQFLELYLAMAKVSGIHPIFTIGSDAHKVDEIGFGIRETLEALSKLGVGEMMSFESRQMNPIRIL